MRAEGKITLWSDDKGYGFISPYTGKKQIFVHIKAFSNLSCRPMAGDIASYTVSTDARGRPCAKEASIVGVTKIHKTKDKTLKMPVFIVTGFLSLVLITAALSSIPVLCVPIYFLVSLVTYTFYAYDKNAAQKRSWRIPENFLHLLALAGGWPGALIAQSQLRHKSSKQSFQFIFWMTVTLNCLAFAWLFSS